MITLYPEQGAGDYFQHLGKIPVMQGTDLTIETFTGMGNLVAYSFPQYPVVDGLSGNNRNRVCINNIPVPRVTCKYLSAPVKEVSQKIGVCWKGGNLTKHTAEHGVTQLASLLDWI